MRSYHRLGGLLFIAVGASVVALACGESGEDKTGASPSADGGSGGSAATGGTSATGGGSTAPGSGGQSGAGAQGGAGAGGVDDGAPSVCKTLATTAVAGQWQSSKVEYENDRLKYATDAENNRLVDFSYAGYHYGEEDPPSVEEVTRLGPESGDQTARIQAALDAIGDREPDELGFRGALVLEPGTYEIHGTVRLRHSGVVLRGSGRGADPQTATILYARGNTPNQRDVVVVGSGNTSIWNGEAANTRTNVTTEYLAAGAMDIDVEDATPFSVGDNVIVRRPSTAEWIAAVEGGGMVDTGDWTPGEIDVVWNRRIVAKAGNELSLDAPLFDHLDRSLSQSTVYKNTRANLVTHVGVESLRIDVENAGGEDEAHAWSAVAVVGAEDAWVRNLTALHFGYAGVKTVEAVRVTIEDVEALDPVAIATGGRMYNFSADTRSQLILVKNCAARAGRHNFVSNGAQTVSGVVFFDSTSDAAKTSSEGHRRWSQALLFDNITETNAPNGGRVVGLYNRGDWGTKHGWSLTHSVLWNYDVDDGHAVVQKPPTGQNYAIGGSGDFRASGPWSGPAGFMEQEEGELLPHSLYVAQLCERFWEGRLRSKVVGSP